MRGKAEVIALNQRVAQLFARAYRFLRAAKEIRDDWAAANAERSKAGQVNLAAYGLVQKYFAEPIAALPGKVRRLFISALTPDGPVNYLSATFSEGHRVVLLKGQPGVGKSTLLARLAQAAVERGLVNERYYCGFDPLRLEHLYLPQLRLGFITCNGYHQYGEESSEAILDLDESLAAGPSGQAIAREDREVFADLIHRAVSCLGQAKETHDRMERYYAPNMRFAEVTALRGRILRRILDYAGAANGAAD